MSIATQTILKVGCKKSYKLEGEKFVECVEGTWSSEIGHCLKVCPPRLSTRTMRVTCISENKETENCTDPVEGTLAKFECSPFYEDKFMKNTSFDTCQDCVWGKPMLNCVPVCGQTTVDASPVIIGGYNVTEIYYPWQVHLYIRNMQFAKCHGSLLSERIVSTAAYCIEYGYQGRIPKENYIVAVGKYYEKFDDPRDVNEAQFSELQAMYVPNEYKGKIQSSHDIAILITKKSFKLSNRVQPVCLDSGRNYNVTENNYGYFAGWGYDQVKDEVLTEVKVPLLSNSQCINFEKKKLKRTELTDDNLCVGDLNTSNPIFFYDYGGGLLFKHEGRYYIEGIRVGHGIVRPADGSRGNQYAIYTKIEKYINDFILPKVAEFKT